MSTVRADNFGNRAGTSSVPVDVLLQGTAKVWLNFNGTGVIAIRDSFNVSSIADGGTGLYGVTYSAARSNNQYTVSGQCRTPGVVNGMFQSPNVTSDQGVSASNILSLNSNPIAAQDTELVYLLLHGDPA